VFVSEGIQKFLFSDTLGAGRFATIGLPFSEVLGPIVGTTEIVCGMMILLGWQIRSFAMPLIAIMVVAIVSTKVPMMLDSGLWTFLHESRTDWAMMLGCVGLVLIDNNQRRFREDASSRPMYDSLAKTQSEKGH